MEIRPQPEQGNGGGVRIISRSARQCFLKCGGRLSGSAFDQAACGGQGFVVFQIPDGTGFGMSGCHREVCQSLAEPPVRIQLAQFSQGGQQIVACRVDAHRRSPTVGNVPTRIGRSSITSTVTRVPGKYRATRVARVTPLLITNSPSVPRLTSRGGIPVVDVP